MTMMDYYNRKVPDYYPTMYKDGYSPEQILAAAHQKMLADREPQEETEITIRTEVKFV